MFTAIEGIDASGKATQSQLLAEKTKAKLFSFPDYCTPVGHLILRHLKSEWAARIGATTEPYADSAYIDALMFQALQYTNRLEKAVEISEALKVGNVVADRWIASSIVYGGADGLDVEYLERTQRYLPQPDLNILLDIHPRHSSIRRPDRRDRYEKDNLMEERARRYEEFWDKMINVTKPGSPWWIIIDASQSISKVHEDILEVVHRMRSAGWA